MNDDLLLKTHVTFELGATSFSTETPDGQDKIVAAFSGQGVVDDLIRKKKSVELATVIGFLDSNRAFTVLALPGVFSKLLQDGRIEKLIEVIAAFPPKQRLIFLSLSDNAEYIIFYMARAHEKILAGFDVDQQDTFFALPNATKKFIQAGMGRAFVKYLNAFDADKRAARLCDPEIADSLCSAGCALGTGELMYAMKADHVTALLRMPNVLPALLKERHDLDIPLLFNKLSTGQQQTVLGIDGAETALNEAGFQKLLDSIHAKIRSGMQTADTNPGRKPVVAG